MLNAIKAKLFISGWLQIGEPGFAAHHTYIPSGYYGGVHCNLCKLFEIEMVNVQIAFSEKYTKGL